MADDIFRCPPTPGGHELAYDAKSFAGQEAVQPNGNTASACLSGQALFSYFDDYNGTAYAYLYNQQDDVIGLVDSNGTKMVSYSYDAWGKPISKTGTLATTLGKLNPFRYRGYIFDEEDFHTYFVGSAGVLVHNSCHGAEWNKERRRYWRKEGRKYNKASIDGSRSASGTYDVTQDNVKRMLRGSAPIGTDDLPVALHHNKGIANDFFDYGEMLTSQHRKTIALFTHGYLSKEQIQ